MGIPEMAIIFLVPFLALGPNRAIDMARSVGKVLGEIKRTVNEVISATNINSDVPTNQTVNSDKNSQRDEETPQ